MFLALIWFQGRAMRKLSQEIEILREVVAFEVDCVGHGDHGGGGEEEG